MPYRRRPPSGPRSSIDRRHAVVWIDADTYASLLHVMKDPHGMPFSHDRWQEFVEDQERYWKRRGDLVSRIKVNPQEFMAWCVLRQVDPSRDALKAYAHEMIIV